MYDRARVEMQFNNDDPEDIVLFLAKAKNDDFRVGSFFTKLLWGKSANPSKQLYQHLFNSPLLPLIRKFLKDKTYYNFKKLMAKDCEEIVPPVVAEENIQIINDETIIDVIKQQISKHYPQNANNYLNNLDWILREGNVQLCS